MTYPKRLSNSRWIIEVKEKSQTKELYIKFPPGCIDQVGWDIGDEIEWHDEGDGSWMMSKKEK